MGVGIGGGRPSTPPNSDDDIIGAAEDTGNGGGDGDGVGSRKGGIASRKRAVLGVYVIAMV